jgi:hypothetical protein
MELITGYRVPLDFQKFFKERKFGQCTIQESIATYIHLLVITCYEEFEFDPEFGCEIWDFEFEHQQSTRIWVERLGKNIQERLAVYEKRLTNITVKADVSQAEFESTLNDVVSVRLKKKLNIKLSARLASTNETFHFEDNILLSPFSTD